MKENHLNLWEVLESAAGFHDQLVNDPVLEVLLQNQRATVLRHVEVPVPFVNETIALNTGGEVSQQMIQCKC